MGYFRFDQLVPANHFAAGNPENFSYFHAPTPINKKPVNALLRM
jgi:hypothetical protein